MKLITDENIPALTVQELKAAGHDVRDARADYDELLKDNVLWQLAQQEERILLTTDKGFSEYRYEAHFGILIIALKKSSEELIQERVEKALKSRRWRGVLCVMKESGMSIWKKDGP